MCRSLHSSADSSLSANPTGQQLPSTRGTGTELETVKRTLDVIHSLLSEAFFRKAQSSEPFCFCIPAAVSMCALASFHFVSLSSCLFFWRRIFCQKCWDYVIILAKLSIKCFDPLRMKIYAQFSSFFLFGTAWLSGESCFTLFKNIMPVINNQRVDKHLCPYLDFVPWIMTLEHK